MKKAENYFAELRQQDRIFRLDRDTVLAYTGKNEKDARPFLRIGAGASLPTELLKHIENVVLAEQEWSNVGMELAWMKATLGAGGESVRYVGSRERVAQIFAYSGLTEMDPEERPPVEMAPFGAFNAKVETKQKCIIMFMATGNFQITLNSGKLLDYFSFRNQKMNIDKEYELISKAVSKREKKGAKGTGFIVPNAPLGDHIPMYWFFEGKSLIVNPAEDFHYDLFENGLDPDGVSMALADSIQDPGFVEFARRKNVLKEVAGIACADGDHLPLLKRVYPLMRWKMFDDGRPLPMADQAVFFKSKTGSHGIFSVRLDPDSHEHIQVLFPLSPHAKQNKSFDYTKGPFDLEIMRVESKEDLHPEKPSRLTLHSPGKIDPAVYGKTKLSDNSFPLLPHCEYTFLSPESAMAAADMVLHAIEHADCKDSFNQILMVALSGNVKDRTADQDLEILNALKVWAKLKPSMDMVERQNICCAIQFVEWLVRSNIIISEPQKKLVQTIAQKNRMNAFTVSDWEGLGHAVFRIVTNGKLTMMIVEPSKGDAIRIRIPRTIEEIAADPKSQQVYLRQLGRTLDKMDEPPGYRQCLEFAEKVLEDRLLIVQDRKRLTELKNHLGIHRTDTNVSESFWQKLLRSIGLGGSEQKKAA